MLRVLGKKLAPNSASTLAIPHWKTLALLRSTGSLVRLKEDTYIKVMGKNPDLFQHQLESYCISHRAARRLLLSKVATGLYSSKTVSHTRTLA